MLLSDFTPLIELAATLNIAFVAVEVAKGYTNILLNKVFNFKDLINQDFDSLESRITLNKDSLEHIEPTLVGSGKTNHLIEATKRQYEVILKEVNDKKEELHQWADNNCEFKCFSGLSLMMFLYCCLLLFLSAFDYSFSIGISTIFTIVYCVISYIHNKRSVCCSLKFVIAIFIVNLLISMPFMGIDALWTTQFFSYLESPIIITAALLPFANFVVFYIMIMRKVKDMKQTVTNSKQTFEDSIAPIDEQFKRLQSLDELKVAIQPDEPLTK